MGVEVGTDVSVAVIVGVAEGRCIVGVEVGADVGIAVAVGVAEGRCVVGVEVGADVGIAVGGQSGGLPDPIMAIGGYLTHVRRVHESNA